MKLTASDLKELGHIAETAATEAGKLISEYAQKSFLTQSKKGGSSYASQVFTEVDLLSQELILKSLMPTIKKYDLGILTEESEDDNSRFGKDYFWCIDPLDGTLPFIEKTDGYSVSIALVSKAGVPYIGVIYNPVKHDIYSSIKGQGAYKNKDKWESEGFDTPSNSSITLVCDRSFLKHKLYKQSIDKINLISQELGYKAVKIISHGGAAMNAIWVLENAPACYLKFPKPEKGGGSIWDYAATACLFNELKCPVSNFFGNALNLNNSESCFMNKEGILFASDKQLANTIRRRFETL